MQVDRLEIPDVLLLTPRRFHDDRGYFAEVYSARQYALSGVNAAFIQDNLSCSRQAGTLRGLHYQRPPFAQAKLVSVIKGRVLDVAVDVRRGSPTYGKHVARELSADRGDQMFVPVGFLHGFLTLEPDTIVTYKVDASYSAADDGAIRWDAPELGISWPLEGPPLLSARDAAAPTFADFDTPFAFNAGAAS